MPLFLFSVVYVLLILPRNQTLQLRDRIIPLFIFLAFITGPKSYCQYSRNIDSLQNVLSGNLPDSVRVNVLSDIGGYQIQSREFTKALTNFTEALNLAQITHNKKALSTILQRIGVLYMNQNNYSEAAEYYNKALVLKKELGDKKGIADITSNMGIIYSDQGEYAKAIENYFQALKIREEIKDIYGTGISMISIANIYFLKDDYKTALDYYNKAVQLKGILEYKPFVAEVKTNIGLTYYRMNDLNRALEYFNAAMKIDEELGDKQGIGIAKSNIGDVYARRKDYKNALKLMNESRVIFEEIGDKKALSEVYFEIGNIYDSIGDPIKATEFFNLQLSISKEIGSRVNIKNAYQGLSEASEKMNKYPEALYYHVLFKAMDDSIRNESGSKTIAELEAKYQSEKKEKEIALLKKEQELKNAEDRRRNLLISGIIAFAIMVAVTVFLFYNRSQLKKKNVLEKKNYELEKNALASQMNPHFIFNSLGSISGFIAENEKDKAIEYLGVFSKLIRHNLEQSREQIVSVTQEAQMLRSYLHLQQIRFENKFSYEVIIDDNIDASLGLPPMFVQPFVENAIIHGIIPKDGKGHISIRFRLNANEELECEVQDDGIGIAASRNKKTEFDTQQKSLAMKIAAERMEILNTRNKQKINISVRDDPAEKGTKVELTFPQEYV
jgi:tetratricopeptide (TPR) repeat protein